MTRILQQTLKLFAQNTKIVTFTQFWTFQVEKRICLWLVAHNNIIIVATPTPN